MLTIFVAILALLTPQAFAIINTHAVEGYSDVLSAGPGDTIAFKIHLPAGRTDYTVQIYRWGATYVGANAIGSSVLGPLTGTNGIVQDFDGNSYVNGAGWTDSFTLTIPSATTFGASRFPPLASRSLAKATWKSGYYTAKVTDSVSKEFFHITFIVKDGATTRKPIAVIASTNTWTAYNFWPGEGHDDGTGHFGSSIYAGLPGLGGARNVVTFQRPNPYATPEVHDDVDKYPVDRPLWRTEHLAAGEIRIARWLEANRKTYSVLTDWDLHSIANVLDPAVFKTVIISTHSEYWSPQMRNALIAYLNAGGNVISLSGNTCYWNTTLTDSGVNRTLTKNVIWTPQEQASVFGLGTFDVGQGPSGVNYSLPSGAGFADVTPYYLRRPTHWAFTSIPGQAWVGLASVLSYRSFDNDGTRGASGWEVDRTDPTLKNFAREFSDLGESVNYTQHSHIIYMRRASAGQVFSVGSILAGQSLMVDAPLSKTLLTVLGRFATTSFGDMNRDGHPDLLTRSSDGAVNRYNGNGSATANYIGSVTPLTVLPNWSTMDRVLSPGDIDSDGISDIVTRSVDGRLWFYKGLANGTLKTGVVIGKAWNAFDLIITPGDFDHDGRNDLIARKPGGADLGSLWLYRGDGKGKFITPTTPFNPGWDGFNSIIGAGDFNEDGDVDLLARNAATGTLVLYYGDGHGNVVSGPDVSVGFDIYTELIACGDFDNAEDANHLRHADLLVRDGGGKLWLYSGNGDGTLNPRVQVDDAGWDGFTHVVGVW